MFNWLILGSMPGPWLPGDQAETGPYPSQAAPSWHSPNRKGNWHWIAQPADVHHSYAGLVSFILPSRKGKTPKLPCNYWEPQEKSEKYSLWVESLMTTIQTIPGFCLLSYRRKEERKEVFILFFRICWWKFWSPCCWLNESVNPMWLSVVHHELRGL